VLARLLTGAGPLGSQLLTTTAAVAELLPAEAGEAFALLPGVRVFPSPAAVLTAAEAELLGRARRLADTDSGDLAAYRQLPDAEPVPAVLLLAHTPDTPGQAARAQAMLQLAGGRDLGAVWLGPWPPAGLHVTADGTVHAQQPDRSEPAAAVLGRVELLSPADAADLLAGLLPAVRDSLDVLDPPPCCLPPPRPSSHQPPSHQPPSHQPRSRWHGPAPSRPTAPTRSRSTARPPAVGRWCWRWQCSAGSGHRGPAAAGGDRAAGQGPRPAHPAGRAPGRADQRPGRRGAVARRPT